MNEYEQMVKNSNILYKKKFKEDREIMFNPKLNSNNNELLLSTLMKKISERQRTRQSSFLIQTKTNINLFNTNNNKYESLNSIDNSQHRERKLKMKIVQKNSQKKNTIVDEQKNPEQDNVEQYLSKLKTPFKFRKNNLLEKNKSDVSCNIPKNKLIRRFSAMPKMPKNSLNKINCEGSKINLYCKENNTKETKRYNQNTPIKNNIDHSKKENENKNKNDMNIFKKQIKHKKKKSQAKSVKSTNALFPIEKSILINNKDKKWKMQYKNYEEYKKFPFLNRKEKVEKNLFDPNIILNNEIKEVGYLNNEKNIKLFSFTEQSQKIQPNKLFNKKLPKLFHDKQNINN